MNRRLLALALLLPLAALASGLTGNETISTIAGTGVLSSSGNGGPASAATLSVYHLHTDGAGNLYVVDPVGSQVRKIDAAGTITAVAGNGFAGSTGDNGPATQAMLYSPNGVAVDGQGNVYIADRGNSRIRKVTAGIITTFAGASPGFSGDGMPAAQAQLSFPYGVTVAPDGSVYIADSGNYRIRKVNPAGIISTIAGNGMQGTNGGAGDGGPALQASFANPVDVAFDAAGNLFVLDAGWNRVRRIDTAGNIHTHAGGGTLAAEGTPGAQFQFTLPGRGFAVDVSGNVFVTENGLGAKRVYKIDAAPPHAVTIVAGTGVSGFSGDGGPARLAQIQGGNGLEFDAQGNLYVGDYGRIRKISVPQAANLEVAKSCQPGQVNVNQNFTCTLTVTNRGPGGASAVQVVDTLSPTAGVTLVSAGASAGACPTATPGLVICNLGALAASGTASVTVVLSASQPGTYADTAAVTSPEADPNLGNNTAPASTLVVAPNVPADISVTKTAASSSVTLGREVRFSVGVTNNGPNPASGVRVTDIPSLPPARVLAQSSWSCSGTGVAPVECSLPLLAAGQSAPPVEVTVVPTAPGQVCNTVTGRAAQTDPVPGNNTPPQVCVTVVAPFTLNQFVAFGNERLLIDRRSRVVSGAVGANRRAANNTPEVLIRGALAQHPAFFVLGDTVLLDGSRIANVRSNEPVQLLNGAAVGVQQPAGSFPSLVLPALQPANPEAQASGDIVVAANQVRSLAPGRYRSVTVNEGGTLNLQGYHRLVAPPGTASDYDFLDIELKADARILFGVPNVPLTAFPLGVQVRVQGRVHTGARAVIGPASAQGGLNGSHIVFHVGGSDIPALQPQNVVYAVDVGRYARVRANIYAPNGSVLLNVGASGTGAFIGRNFAGNAVALTLESAFQP